LKDYTKNLKIVDFAFSYLYILDMKIFNKTHLKEFKNLLSHINSIHNRNHLYQKYYDDEYEIDQIDHYVLVCSQDTEPGYLMEFQTLDIIKHLLYEHYISILESPEKINGQEYDDSLAPLRTYYLIIDYEELVKHLESIIEKLAVEK
jgi:hypothetical protein